MHIQTEAEIRKLAYTIHLALDKLRKKESEGMLFSVILTDTLIEHGYAGSFADLLSLTYQWTNDLASWVESVFDITTHTGNINTWKIGDVTYEAFSQKYFDVLHSLITNIYESKA